MTLDEIRRAVKHISDVRDDPEVASGEERDLRDAFISYIAGNPEGYGHLAEMAREVKGTNNIQFRRR